MKPIATTSKHKMNQSKNQNNRSFCTKQIESKTKSPNAQQSTKHKANQISSCSILPNNENNPPAVSQHVFQSIQSCTITIICFSSLAPLQPPNCFSLPCPHTHTERSEPSLYCISNQKLLALPILMSRFCVSADADPPTCLIPSFSPSSSS